MKFKLTMTVTKTWTPDPESYGDPLLTDPKEMLAIDVSAYEDDPMAFVEQDDTEITVVGEVVEG